MKVTNYTVEAVIEVAQRHKATLENVDLLKSITHPAVHRYACLLDALDAEVKYELIAIARIGDNMGYTPDDFASLVEESRGFGPDHSAEWLATKPIDEYLRLGMEKMGLSAA